MAIEGIPETLAPISETAERSHFAATEPRPAPMRRRATSLSREQGEEPIEDDAEESHVLDDLL